MPRILVSEDDVSICSVIDCMLSAKGHVVNCVHNGMDAIDHLLRIDNYFDLLITDLHLPGMDGLEVAYAARMLVPDLPIILMSGQATPQHLLKTCSKDISAFIEKPFSINKLCGLVDEIAFQATSLCHAS